MRNLTKALAKWKVESLVISALCPRAGQIQTSNWNHFWIGQNPPDGLTFLACLSNRGHKERQLEDNRWACRRWLCRLISKWLLSRSCLAIHASHGALCLTSIMPPKQCHPFPKHSPDPFSCWSALVWHALLWCYKLCPACSSNNSQAASKPKSANFRQAFRKSRVGARM